MIRRQMAERVITLHQCSHEIRLYTIMKGRPDYDTMVLRIMHGYVYTSQKVLFLLVKIKPSKKTLLPNSSRTIDAPQILNAGMKGVQQIQSSTWKRTMVALLGAFDSFHYPIFNHFALSMGLPIIRFTSALSRFAPRYLVTWAFLRDELNNSYNIENYM
jgi:hypothetical protein